MSDLTYKVIVGLEIHVQLNTNTKLFCGCELSFGERGNSRVCPVCLGMPGVLPVMNRKAYEYSVLAALALNLNIPKFTKWDRKSYYYPDLPKGFQTSQYDLPMSEHGHIDIPLPDGSVKPIRILRAHLEEDAGKNTHTSGAYSQVDLNRAGTPLLEIVTEPDLSSGEEVRIMAQELQRIIRYLGVSIADMQKGHMRFEPNINLHITKGGKLFKTPISEIKNLNSFRALERSVTYEVQRQLDDFVEYGVTMETGPKTTRGWDDVNQMTVLQREKEAANDYRYFPEPDLVPIEITDDWLAEIKSQMPELPLAKQKRFADEFGMSDYDAGVLTAERSLAEYFEEAVNAGGDAKRVCNILTQKGLKLANDAGCRFEEFGIAAGDLAELAKLVDGDKISTSSADKILEAMIETKKGPGVLADEMKLIQKSDAGELEAMIDSVFAANPQAVEDAKPGAKKMQASRGFLTGQVMRASKGQANPKLVQKILAEKLDA